MKLANIRHYLLGALLVSSPLFAEGATTENLSGFTAKQSEVVGRAFDILNGQMWDQLSEENLVTLSQAAAIAMDSKNAN